VGIDALRIVAIAVVVVAHVWTDNYALRLASYTWHVPVFFFLSGYLVSPGRPLRRELAARWRTLGVPYIVWLVLITLLVATAGWWTTGVLGAPDWRALL
jgi:acyltransferase